MHANPPARRIIAMWSGPRNVSTALMYSFAQRADTAVWDEPYYAAWLAATGLDHPMRAETLAAGLADPVDVAMRVQAARAPVFYQKHMAHHMLADFDLGQWFDRATHAFLIRPPEPVLASYVAKHETVTLDLVGYPQQRALFERAADRLGRAPPVILGPDIQARPEPALRALTAALGLDFDPAMLAWPAGPKPYDGAWAAHWYDRVWRTTGFAGPATTGGSGLPPDLARIAAAARPHYEALARHAIAIPDTATPAGADAARP